MFLGIITIDASESYNYSKHISEIVDLLNKAVKKGLLKMVEQGEILNDGIKIPETIKEPINTDLNSEIEMTTITETITPTKVIKRSDSCPSDIRAEKEKPQKQNKSIYLNKNNFIYQEQKWLGGSMPEIIDYFYLTSPNLVSPLDIIYSRFRFITKSFILLFLTLLVLGFWI